MSRDTSSSRKRSGSASYLNDDDTSPPPPSKRATRSRPSPTDAQASDRVQDDARSWQADEWSIPYDFENIIEQSSFLEYLKIWHRKFAPPFERCMLQMLSFAVKKGRSDDIKMSVESIDRWFESYPQPDPGTEQDALTWVKKGWEELLAEIYKPQAPSSFCKSSHWVHQQNGAAFINCLRPPECTGLPLSLLHPLFAEFSALIEEPPPDDADPKFILAQRVATTLCQEMTRPFDTERSRLDEFRRIASPIFTEIGVLSEVDVGSGRADFGLQPVKVGLVLVGEGKNEPGGSAGDPYMHVAASYDAWARRVAETKQINTGCPCFVCCIDGPSILFGGGFRDNKVSVVEPLSGWCVMMPHVELERELILARHLYTLLHCLSDQSKFLERLPSTTACCPRIYDAFKAPNSAKVVPLTFVGPFKNPWHRRRGVYDLLFHALVEEKEGSASTSVLVKVPIGSTYGVEPHEGAARDGFAPRLLGTAKAPGAPAIYVMELLSKSDGWFHLLGRDRPKDITNQQKEKFRDCGKELLSFLEQNQLVHGDLRGCNIMYRLVDNDVNLRVLDWDWAGKQGTARYPAALNMEIGYQGSPGGLIEASHDKDMFEKALDDFLSLKSL